MLEIVRPRVFFEVGIGSDLTGKIVVELFSDLCPKLAESFRKLCGDDVGRDGPFYSGGSVVKIVRDSFVQVIFSQIKRLYGFPNAVYISS